MSQNAYPFLEQQLQQVCAASLMMRNQFIWFGASEKKINEFFRTSKGRLQMITVYN